MKTEYLWREDECTKGLPGHTNIEDVMWHYTSRNLVDFKESSWKRITDDFTEWWHVGSELVVGFCHEGWYIRTACNKGVEP